MPLARIVWVNQQFSFLKLGYIQAGFPNIKVIFFFLWLLKNSLILQLKENLPSDSTEDHSSCLNVNRLHNVNHILTSIMNTWTQEDGPCVRTAWRWCCALQGGALLPKEWASLIAQLFSEPRSKETSDCFSHRYVKLRNFWFYSYYFNLVEIVFLQGGKQKSYLLSTYMPLACYFVRCTLSRLIFPGTVWGKHYCPVF